MGDKGEKERTKVTRDERATRNSMNNAREYLRENAVKNSAKGLIKILKKNPIAGRMENPAGRCCARSMKSPIGELCLEANEEGITSLYIKGTGSDSRNRYMDAECGVGAEDCIQEQILEQACQELTEYFAGVRTVFTVPLHLQGTEFQLKAWNALRSIPYGETRSYSEIAEMIGNPRACRAIGGANNKNPVMLFVPCHRVVGKSGALVGFTGGLDTKKYLLEMEQRNRFGDDSQSPVIRSCISDRKDFSEEIAETVPYHVNKCGEYTLKDYYALSDERRTELIDGVFYDMAAPTTAHQTAVGEIWFQIRSYIGGKDGKCIPFMSPVDIQLDCDDRTMVQPDIAVVCDKDKVIKCCVFGAPDLVIEVLSDSSVMRDTVIKLAKYKNAGVREYWIVDLKRKKILVYEFEKSEMPVLYGVDAQIPVGILGGDCVIDFASVYKSVEMLGNQE